MSKSQSATHHRQRIGEAAIGRTCARQDATGLVHHVAERIHGDKRGDHQPAGQLQGRAAYPGRACAGAAKRFAGGTARPHANAALDHGLVRGGQTSRITHLGVRIDIGTADRQVEQDGRGDDRHARHTRIVADAALAQVAHHAIGGRQPERAAAGKDHGMDVLHQVHRPQKVGLTRAGRAPR